MKTKLDKPIEDGDIVIFKDHSVWIFKHSEFWGIPICVNKPEIPSGSGQEIDIDIELPQMEYQIPNTELQCYLVPKQDREYWLNNIVELTMKEYYNRIFKSGEYHVQSNHSRQS